MSSCREKGVSKRAINERSPDSGQSAFASSVSRMIGSIDAPGDAGASAGRKYRGPRIDQAATSEMLRGASLP
jgi:hypothetical protein